MEQKVVLKLSDYHSYAPEDGHKLQHNPFKALIAPRPIGWISTLSKSGVTNLAPYSYFNAVAESPPMLAFCSTGKKHSVSNILETGEFVHNVVDLRMARDMNETSANFAVDVSEFEQASLAALPSVEVAPMRVAGALAAMECKLLEVKQLQDVSGAFTQNYLVLGQVVHVHINRTIIRDGVIDEAALHLIGRLGHVNYVSVENLFSMRRPVSEV